MSSLQNLVVGVDGSEGSARAFGWALAQSDGGRVVAVHGFSPAVELFAGAVQINLDPVRAEHLRLLEGEWIDAAAASTATVTTKLIDSHPAAALLLAAKGGDQAVIVIGHQGNGRWSEDHVGDVATRLLHHSGVPIVMINLDTKPEPLDGPIAVCVHGPTTPSHHPVRWAANLAAERSLPLHIVSVTEPLLTVGSDGYGGYSVEAYRRDLRAVHDANIAATAELERALRAAHPATAVTSETRQGHPTEALREALTDKKPALAVIGNHHHSKIAAVLTYSVARHLPALVSCPVVAVPAE